MKNNVVVYSTVGMFCVAILLYVTQKSNPSEHVQIENRKDRCLFSSKDDKSIVNTLIKERNNLSRMLNLARKQIGQLECEALKKNTELKTSGTGGWCPDATQTKHNTDTGLVQAFVEFFQDKNVGSFGDGPGLYKKYILEAGKVKSFDAYDGAPYCETTSEGRVKFLDLSIPQYGLKVYDWILSLEVAEHIPKEFEQVFVDNIVRHAREGVIISWATPGQTGYSHVNNQPFEYVKSLMQQRGFVHDVEYSDMMKKSAKGPNLRRNVNVFWRLDKQNIYSNNSTFV